jgi:hypothetical protein
MILKAFQYHTCLDSRPPFLVQFGALGAGCHRDQFAQKKPPRLPEGVGRSRTMRRKESAFRVDGLAEIAR